MSEHAIHISIDRGHFDTNSPERLLCCYPGVDITVSFHPGYDAAALALFERAVADVRARLAQPTKGD